jgi:hypothetical protein
LQEDFTELTQRETAVIAVAQEDTELAQHARFLKAFKTPPPFDIVADLNRKATSRYHRTTAYLIDKQGVVRQVFPMTIRRRAPWSAVWREIDAAGLGGKTDEPPGGAG